MLYSPKFIKHMYDYILTYPINIAKFYSWTNNTI